jgi:lipopolysaccharide cholinephosphotransferase
MKIFAKIEEKLAKDQFLISDQEYAKIRETVSEKQEMELLHEEIMKIYKQFKKIADKHNLQYFAEGGTWVGAALLNDFIPWDDDMDLRMPRKDFNKFLGFAKKELPKNLEILNCTMSEFSAGNMVKICNKNTTFVESTKVNSPNQWNGIFIDITPLDNAPDDAKKREKYHKIGTKLFIYNILRKNNHIKLDIDNFRETWWYSLFDENGLSPPKNRTEATIVYVWVMSHDANYFAKRLDELWEKSGFDNKSEYVACPERPWEKNGKILYIPRKYYNDKIDIKFRDSIMPLPVGYNEISEMSYGFRPTLRVNRDIKYKHLQGGFFDTKKSYEDYYEMAKRIQDEK